MKAQDYLLRGALLAVALGIVTQPAVARPKNCTENDTRAACQDGGGDPPPPPPDPTPTLADGPRDATYYNWMHTEVDDAWNQNAAAVGGYDYLGSGVSITFVDDFTSSTAYQANFGDGTATLRHGEWTSKEGGMVAPRADIWLWDFNNGDFAVPLQETGLNVFNASYGWISSSSDFTTLGAQEQSLVDHAATGAAVLAKSAGNTNGLAVGAPSMTLVLGKGPPRNIETYDIFSLGLIDAATDDPDTFSGIWVGALEANSTEVWDGSAYSGERVGIADYSAVAGTNTVVQDHFLVVGVRDDITGLAGTSFAAPIVAGYAAILGSKFDTATPAQVANRLLETARTDTLVDLGEAGYGAEDRAVYGMGEASIVRAMAADSLSPGS